MMCQIQRAVLIQEKCTPQPFSMSAKIVGLSSNQLSEHKYLTDIKLDNGTTITIDNEYEISQDYIGSLIEIT